MIEYVVPAPVTTDITLLLEPPVPVVHFVQVPQVHVIEKILEILEIQTVQGTQTSDSFCFRKMNSLEIREKGDGRVNEEVPEMMNPQMLKGSEQRETRVQTMDRRDGSAAQVELVVLREDVDPYSNGLERFRSAGHSQKGDFGHDGGGVHVGCRDRGRRRE